VVIDLHPKYRSASVKEDYMGEHIQHKKESKKAPQNTLNEKRDEQKHKKKGTNPGIPNT
jgi:hypothetical protein